MRSVVRSVVWSKRPTRISEIGSSCRLYVWLFGLDRTATRECRNRPPPAQGGRTARGTGCSLYDSYSRNEQPTTGLSRSMRREP